MAGTLAPLAIDDELAAAGRAARVLATTPTGQ
jgi:hypothetical protein